MPAAVQTKSRQNRLKLFKKYYQTAQPSFRCYHKAKGLRLPPKTYAGLWKHSKFFSKDIKVGQPKKPKKKSSLLDKKQKALPLARGKRGPITARRVGKKKPVIKQLKRKKSVTWSKVKQFAETREQMPGPAVREGEGHRFIRGQDPTREEAIPGHIGRAFQFQGPAVQRQFRKDAAGNLVAFAPRARRVGLVY